MGKLGEKLKELRKLCKLTQNQISDYLGIDQTYLSKIESGERAVPVELLEKLAILYGIELIDFEKKNIKINPLKFSLRSNGPNGEDLKDIACIKEIATNSEKMAIAIKEGKW